MYVVHVLNKVPPKFDLVLHLALSFNFFFSIIGNVGKSVINAKISLLISLFLLFAYVIRNLTK